MNQSVNSEVRKSSQQKVFERWSLGMLRLILIHKKNKWFSRNSEPIDDNLHSKITIFYGTLELHIARDYHSFTSMMNEVLRSHYLHLPFKDISGKVNERWTQQNVKQKSTDLCVDVGDNWNAFYWPSQRPLRPGIFLFSEAKASPGATNFCTHWLLIILGFLGTLRNPRNSLNLSMMLNQYFLTFSWHCLYNILHTSMSSPTFNAPFSKPSQHFTGTSLMPSFLTLPWHLHNNSLSTLFFYKNLVYKNV